MIEEFRSWISAILCIGIFISLLELILPKSKVKKYIYVLVGIVTTITIISPGINLLKNDDVSQSVLSVMDNFSGNINEVTSIDIDKYKNSQENLVKEEFINKLKSDIESKLNLRGINVTDIYIKIDEEYNIEKLQVKIKKLEGDLLTKVNKVIEYINTEYDIDYSKIEVIESGD